LASGRTSRHTRAAFRTGALAVLLFLGCSFPAIERPTGLEPGSAAEHAWERLRALESFGFRLHYHTDAPFELGSDFSGTWHSPAVEAWSGRWWRAGESGGVRLVGSGEFQYEHTGGGWQKSARGFETKVFEQVEHMLTGSSPEFREERGGKYRYDFAPKARFLDPAGVKQFTGTLEVETRYGLPTRLFCADATRTAEWELVLGGYNRAGRVGVPFVPELALDIAPARRAGRQALGQAVRVLRDRLAQLGWDYRLNRVRGRLVLALDREIGSRPLALLLGPGRIELWRARWLTAGGGTPNPGTVVEVAGDAASRAVLVRRLGGNGDLSFEVGGEVLPEPRLLVSSGQPWPDDGEAFVLLVDGEALGSSSSPAVGPAEFSGLGTADFTRVLAVVGAASPAAVGFRVVGQR